MSELLTVGELAARLRVRPCTIQRWTRRGRLPAVRLSAKIIRYDLAAVLAALESQGRQQEANQCQS
jgi:excisionase family DNA binding protein